MQTRVYNADGKMTSKYVAQKDTAYSYDSYSRMNKLTTPGGAVSTYTYNGNGSNENTKIAASIGPNVCMTYDRYGNLLTTSTYDPDAGTKYEMKYDTKTGEIYLESKDGKIQIPTRLKHIP